MTFQEIVNQATQGLSDNKLSKMLGIARQGIPAWRINGSIPKDEVLDKLAEMADVPVEQVYFAAYAEKVHNPRVAEKFRHLAA